MGAKESYCVGPHSLDLKRKAGSETALFAFAGSFDPSAFLGRQTDISVHEQKMGHN
jgi:hypothetical protein